jgi:hypothetical protein
MLIWYIYPAAVSRHSLFIWITSLHYSLILIWYNSQPYLVQFIEQAYTLITCMYVHICIFWCAVWYICRYSLLYLYTVRHKIHVHVQLKMYRTERDTDKMYRDKTYQYKTYQHVTTQCRNSHKKYFLGEGLPFWWKAFWRCQGLQVLFSSVS